MDKRKVDQNVYERYVDATVALFMEYYSAERAEDMHKELAGNEKIEVAFPNELDERCRTLIKKEHARRQRKQHLKSAMKGLRFVASFAVIILALASVLFISVEAIRVPIINYYITQNGQYLEFTSRQPEVAEDIGSINTEDPLAGLLPEGYELAMLDDGLPKRIVAIYKSSNNNSIYFSMNASVTVVKVDAEDTQVVKEIQVCGHEGVFVVKDGKANVTWGDKSTERTFMLISSELTETDLISLAEMFMRTLE